MTNANITAPTTTQTGNFNVTVTFQSAVPDFTADKITLTAVSGNGITGITFEMTGSGTTYNATFQLPEDVSGSLQIEITGMVTPEGASNPETVTANTPTVVYNNITNVTATFGSVEYRDDGVIVVPITFGENVIAPSKAVFQVSHVSGDSLQGVEYRMVGKDDAYELIFEIPQERSGSFQIAAVADVLKESSGIRDNVIATPKTVNYDTRTPRIVDYDIPANYTHGAKFDVRVAYNVPVTGWHVNNTFTEIFIEEGAHLGAALPYKWTGSSPPDFETPVPDDLTGTDWQLLATPPGGHQGAWHGEEAQYYLIRFPRVENTAIGVFQITPRDSGVRGPVS